MVLSLFCIVSESGNLCLDSLSYLEEEQYVRLCVKDAQGGTICSGKEKKHQAIPKDLWSPYLLVSTSGSCAWANCDSFDSLKYGSCLHFFTTVFICLSKEVPFFLSPGFLNPEKYLLWGCHLLRLNLGAGCWCRSKETEEESACSFCGGNHIGLNPLQWMKALVLFFISYPFVTFPCHFPLTALAVVLYFVHRLLLFQIPGFV